jgi:monoamine oxidase
MLDVAVVGGGVCGLALARRLSERGLDYGVFEARPRAGGRVLSRLCPVSAINVDLGPTWFWPETEPFMALLASELGLKTFPQTDDGTLMVLAEPDEPVRKLDNQLIHTGAMRLAGGMSALIDRLLQRIPESRLHLEHVLAAVADRGDRVELTFLAGEKSVTVGARRAVLAMPPRLVEEHVSFQPDLDEALFAAMLATPTAMASEAKAVMTYGAMPGFYGACGSGNAFVHHEQAVLREIFDASADGKHALGGFLAMSPDLRKSFRGGLPLLVASQFAQIFGAGFDQGNLHIQDWATEPYTCASQDRREAAAHGFPLSSRLLRQRQWDGRLIFAGTETAETGAGHLEGALDAALRAEAVLLRDAAPVVPARDASSAAITAKLH